MNRDELQDELLADVLERHGGDETAADFYIPRQNTAIEAYCESNDSGRALTEAAETLLITLRDGKRDGGWDYEKHAEFAGAVKELNRVYYWLRKIQDVEDIQELNKMW